MCRQMVVSFRFLINAEFIYVDGVLMRILKESVLSVCVKVCNIQ